MENTLVRKGLGMSLDRSKTNTGTRIAIPEIAERLSIGRMAVYQLLERRIIPAIRLGRRWIVSRYAYEQWEKTCGVSELGTVSVQDNVA